VAGGPAAFWPTMHKLHLWVLYALLDTAVTAACVAAIIYNQSWSPWLGARGGARGGGPGAAGTAAKPGVEKSVKTA